MAVAVVVTTLCRSSSSPADHRHALRQQQSWSASCALTARSAMTPHRRSGLPRRSSSVVAFAVAVVLAVGLVVFVVVGDQVAQREPVVAGDEVDRWPRAAGLWPYRSLEPVNR